MKPESSEYKQPRTFYDFKQVLAYLQRLEAEHRPYILRDVPGNVSNSTDSPFVLQHWVVTVS